MLSSLKKRKDFISATERLKTNAKKWKFLGRGAIGFAYDMGDGRVCKITTSENEVKSARKIKKSKKKLPYIYEVLDVLVLKKKNKFWRGLIITPKYKKLTENQKVDLYELFCFLDLPPSFRYESARQVKKEITKAVNDYCYAPYPYDNSGLISNLIAKRIRILNKYNILNILRNLKAVNLGPEDMHYENILKDSGGRYILIDVAC